MGGRFRGGMKHDDHAEPAAHRTGRRGGTSGYGRENRRRLRELGVFRGGTVEFVGAAPLGDPVAVQALDTRIALRQTLAARVLVRTEAPTHSELPS